MNDSRYSVVDENGIKFWVYDSQTDRRLRPRGGADAYYDEDTAQKEADKLNGQNRRQTAKSAY